ncbi:hypothetical protein SLEP1_g52807 [Rubroshorea leprosula]|uniref:Uncharacterized protein n=1 Tax=Rubroshorea leprosula TaxID=152421 RepID=A0AAV5MAV6_9ROSI|nr:hypothetical protein SLEP1_g52807 [Rubroshorea leprosula]
MSYHFEKDIDHTLGQIMHMMSQDECDGLYTVSLKFLSASATWSWNFMRHALQVQAQLQGTSIAKECFRCSWMLISCINSVAKLWMRNMVRR